MRLLVRIVLCAFGLILAISAGTTFLVVASVFDPTLGDFAHRVFWAGFMELWNWLDEPGPMPGGYAVAAAYQASERVPQISPASAITTGGATRRVVVAA